MEQGRYYRVPAWPCYYRSKDAILGAPGLTTIYRDGEIHCISITNYMNTIISLYIYIWYLFESHHVFVFCAQRPSLVCPGVLRRTLRTAKRRCRWIGRGGRHLRSPCVNSALSYQTYFFQLFRSTHSFSWCFLRNLGSDGILNGFTSSMMLRSVENLDHETCVFLLASSCNQFFPFVFRGSLGWDGPCTHVTWKSIAGCVALLALYNLRGSSQLHLKHLFVHMFCDASGIMHHVSQTLSWFIIRNMSELTRNKCVWLTPFLRDWQLSSFSSLDLLSGMSSALDSNLKQKISTLLTEAKSGGGLLKCMNQIYAM